MRFAKKDIGQYLPEKEYIDTVVIPLVPFDPSSDKNMEKQAFLRELNQVFTNVIEKEYRGRIFLSPDYHYMSDGQDEEVERINQWIHHFREQPFKHIFLFTFDMKWKKYEKDIEGELIWVPGLQTGDLQSTETQAFVKEQAKEISELIQSYW
ncbi:YpiF family protein [Halobacillus litoralis]|uniref:YpiF family protein n=1 Tax=Halobacillus litoralis TaxID=45668 RepID=UPI001CD5516A|nr:YpiF family protein [Halobacillus litoralis]MCA0970358.1 YpiF family protein [Halobacillus litoralis]